MGAALVWGVIVGLVGVYIQRNKGTDRIWEKDVRRETRGSERRWTDVHQGGSDGDEARFLEGI